MQSATELIKIEERDGKRTVNARDLWESLKIGRDFSAWIKQRIEETMAEKDIDFTIPKIGERDNQLFRSKIDYFLTIDLAKEICMLERSEQGKKIRKYFIAVEKEFTSNQIQDPKKLIALALIEAQKIIEESRPAIEFYQKVKESENTIDFLRFGRLVKIGRTTLMNILREKGIIDRNNLAYQNLVDVGVFEIKESTYKVDGKEITSLKTVITGKGQAWLVRRLTEWGFLDSGVSLTNKN